MSISDWQLFRRLKRCSYNLATNKIIWSSLLCFSAIAFPVTSQAITVQEVPNPRQVNNTWVTDKANILSDSTEIQLTQMISDLEAKNGSEIAVVTVRFFFINRRVNLSWLQILDRIV